jgi:hypothetical protein
VGKNNDEKTWLTLEQIPEEIGATWREWLGDVGEMETGAYWYNPSLAIVT